MRAAYVENPGPTSRLLTGELPDQRCPSGWRHLRVRACGVNRLDLLTLRGHVKAEPWPHIPGSEVCGELPARSAVPDGVGPGQLVVVAPYLFCGQCDHCLAGDETLCVHGDILGMRSQGGFADGVCVPERSLVPVPDGLGPVEAAALTLAASTAWHMLERADVQPGETVLVQAAGSGVGSAAVQIAKLRGARVLATAGSAEKLTAARRLGADETIDYTSDDVAKRVRSLTGRRGADIVVEHVGASTWAGSVASLARRGRIVTCGATTGSRVETDLWQLFAKELRFIGVYGATRYHVKTVLDLAARGQIRPVVDAVYPLTEAPLALQRLEDRGQFGKLVIAPEARDRPAVAQA